MSEIIVITGSTNRFGKEIYELAQKMRDNGEFVIDDSMFHLLPEEVGRREFMKRILDAKRLLIYNKDGYIGYHTNIEISIASVIGIEVDYYFGKEE